MDFDSAVEDALRNVYDYTYLGNHSLAQFMHAAIDQHTVIKDAGSIVTPADKGKALHLLMRFALNKLKPDIKEPPKLTTDWQIYLVIHEEYFLENGTTAVQLRLEMSEPTFYRRRRYAITAISAILHAIEESAEKWT